MTFKLKKDDLIIHDYKTLKIDKELDHIAYNDARHVYYNKYTGERYTSVTTLIHMYQQDFDTDGWSKYKAIERYITKDKPEDEKKAYFDVYKKQAGGFKNVVNYFTETVIQDDPKRVAYFAKMQQQILAEWKEKNTKALVKGSAYHKMKEDYYTEKHEAYYNSMLYKVCLDNKMDNKYEHAIYPELLIYNDEYKIAGQADLIIRTKNDLTVRDYKTNAKLDFNNQFQKMLYPISDLDDCSFTHYQLQLSMYAYMLNANYGVEVKGLFVDHHTDEKDETHACQYLFEHIEKILLDYKLKYNKVVDGTYNYR